MAAPTDSLASTRGPQAAPWKRRLFAAVVVVCVSAAAFALYHYARVRHVGGCDPGAYYAASLAMRGLASDFTPRLDPRAFPALVPLCHALSGRNVVSIFPPGFPALLALGGALGDAFSVTPLLGAVSVALVYVLASRHAGRAIGVALALVWAATPIVFWGSTQVMSDMPATVATLAAMLLVPQGRLLETDGATEADSRRALAAGALLGLSLAIRPTNLLAAPAALVGQPRRRAAAFVLGLLAGAVPLVAYNFGKFDAPFGTPYAANLLELGVHGYASRLAFLLAETAKPLGPVLVLAVLGLVRLRTRVSASDVLRPLTWFGAFFLFYALWAPGFDAWWWTRYVLPAYPALFELAAIGAAEIRDGLGARVPAWGRWVAVAVTALGAVALAARGAATVHALELVSPTFDEGYEADARAIATRAPGALVGAIGFTVPLRIYGGLESFYVVNEQAPALVDKALDDHRDVLLAVEPWQLEHSPWWAVLRARYDIDDVAPLTQWHDLVLKRVRHRSRTVLIDLGKIAARAYLRAGWSAEEREGPIDFCWAIGPRATLAVTLAPGRHHTIAYRAAAYRIPGRPQIVTVVLDGHVLGERPMEDDDIAVYSVDVPAELAHGDAELEFRFAYAIAPVERGENEDTRPLAASFDWVTVTVAPSSPGAP